ncbi:hypothetical protein DH2020_000851 [Rehmannia glutinosa]|uniref:SHSP domain-containing protein n=1 Tax=Rehmannia glutinosa TaxID=99300 RepID=A0ABR0XXN0_REHGL
MDAKLGAAATNTNNFEPLSDFVQEEDCDTLLIYLPGFTKEQLRVQLTRTGVLKISGTRPLGDNKWSSFQKDFPVSANCDTNKITAKFEDGILYVRQPKLIVPAEKEEQKTRPSKTPHSRIPADEPPAPKLIMNKPPPQINQFTIKKQKTSRKVANQRVLKRKKEIIYRRKLATSMMITRLLQEVVVINMKTFQEKLMLSWQIKELTVML